jgi:alkylation response protein AidB-like acyl-CoA dehydrogenase
MDLDFSLLEQQMRTELRTFLRERLPSDWTGIWRHRRHAENNKTPVEISFELCQELAARGWLNRTWPKEYGGEEAPISEQIVLQEEYEAHFEPRGGQYLGANWIGPAIMRFGTDEQKRKFLPEIAAGKSQWAQLFSEPDAGSDLYSLRTTAYLDGDEFTVNGAKLWTSYANIAKHGFLLARSQPGATGREGLSVLLIDMDNPGVEIRETPSTLGWHRIHEEAFVDAIFPRNCLLGDLHDGWRVATTALSYERSGIAGYARATRVLGRLSDVREPALVEDDVELLVMGRLAELLYYEASLARDTDDAWLSSAVRLMNASYLQAVADHAERMLGPMARVGAEDDHGEVCGEIESFVVKRAPVASITSGTAEVQVGIIARRALGLPRS